MSITTRLRAGAVAALVLVLTVAGLAGVTTAAAAATPIPTIGLARSGHTVGVHPGRQVRLDLPTASDGGYSWAITSRPSPGIATIGHRRVVADQHAAGSAGSPSHTRYLITAKHWGTTSVTLVERQPFDHSKVAHRFHVTISVPRYPAFTGDWSGHTRFLHIGGLGRGTEHVGDGCCDPLIDLTFTLSHPQRRSDGTRTARATITGVLVHKGFAGSGLRAPRKGDVGTVRLRDGVLTESFTKAFFCGPAAAAKGRCGA